jgi:hypothetical protein
LEKEITVYRIRESETFSIVPLNVKRKWMDKSYKKYAYKCLPLNIANQYGFAVISPADFTVDWWGGQERGNVDVHVKSENDEIKNSFHTYFGEGTFTLHVDFVIKTPEGFSTYIRGVPNESRKGIKPLDAIVETDWLPFTFTYNFLITEPGSYEFKKGEPLFVFFPIERNTVENFAIKTKSINDSDEFLTAFRHYQDARNEQLHSEKMFFQNFYRDGKPPKTKVSIKNHITNLIFGGKAGKIK